MKSLSGYQLLRLKWSDKTYVIHDLNIYKMDGNQINKSRIYGSADTAKSAHTDFTVQMAELAAARQQFNNGLVEICQKRQVRVADTMGPTKNKLELRTEVTKMILKFSAGLMVYAISASDEELKTKAWYTVSDMKELADTVLINLGILIVNLATPIKGEMAKYFIGEAEFKELIRLLNEFN